jgi:molybdopterin-guanine dinucleotide biosynthesis protein A
MNEQGPRRTGIVLAGGKSTRLGRDKAAEVLLGRTLLQRALDTLESVADEFVIVKAQRQVVPDILTDKPWREAEDLYSETGPLGGIFTGLSAMRTDSALVVACDMPLLQAPLLAELSRRLAGHDAVTPVNDGQPEPLCAAYTKGCIPAIQRRLDAGAYKTSGLFDDVDALLLEPEEWRRFDPEGLSFLNVNREADLERAKTLIETMNETSQR